MIVQDCDRFMEMRDDSLAIAHQTLQYWNNHLPPERRVPFPEEAVTMKLITVANQLRIVLDSTRELPQEASPDDHCTEALKSLLNDAYNFEQLRRLALRIGVTFNEQDCKDKLIANIISEVWISFKEENPGKDVYTNLFTTFASPTYPATGLDTDLSLINWHLRDFGGGMFEPRLKKTSALFAEAYSRYYLTL